MHVFNLSVYRLQITKTRPARISSATTPPRLAAALTLTPGRSRSASRSHPASTCWSPPPSSRTMRPTSWCGSSARRRLGLCKYLVSSGLERSTWMGRKKSRKWTFAWRCAFCLNREMGTKVDADLPDVSTETRGPEVCQSIQSCKVLLNWAHLSQQPPPPSLPEEETEEEKGLRRLFEQLAGDVRNSNTLQEGKN